MNRVSHSLKHTPAPKRRKFRVEKRWFVMPDGVRLAATLFVPRPRSKGETFPVLLEYLPYRKDDTFYIVDYPCFSYIAQLGFIGVKVDIRGTGASDGEIPEREYSDQEMQDGEEVIRQLSAMPNSNGNVGMFGVSWSGFNSLQMAMRRPPALKAIHAVHASDDLFNDDVHYIDGNLHLDPYHLFINHELGLPRTPDYELSDEYFASRFDRRPWTFTYLGKQLDGEFWRSKSLREDYSRIDIPVYLLGGLLDGYRSATVRMFKNLKVPVRCDIGPWNHSCPDDGTPGPNYEWVERMTQWFGQYLNVPAGEDAAEISAKGAGKARAASAKKQHKPTRESLVYVRHGHEPDSKIETVPGYWRKDALPARGTVIETVALAPASCPRSLAYKAFGGTAAGTWWGDLTGEMAGDDADSLVVDSPALEKPKQIIGSPEVTLTVKSTSPRAKWTVRLEDVSPTGAVSLVTGALVHPALRDGRMSPAWPQVDQEYEIKAVLHFTTWTFQPGHKMRISVANAQVPMTWPSADHMTTTVDFGKSTLSLPVVPLNKNKVVGLPKVADRMYCRDGEFIDVPGGKPDAQTYQRRDSRTGARSHVVKARSAYRIRERKFYTSNTSIWTANDATPWAARYTGIASTTVTKRGLAWTLATRLIVRSDRDNLYVTVTRTLTKNGKVARKRAWHETIPRRFN